jgi:hypothetical protein
MPKNSTHLPTRIHHLTLGRLAGCFRLRIFSPFSCRELKSYLFRQLQPAFSEKGEWARWRFNP